MKTKITAEPGSMKKNLTGGWRTLKPKTDLNKCIGCGICAKVCPEGAISMVTSKYANKKRQPKVNYNYCKGEGICAEECPVKCIQMVREEK